HGESTSRIPCCRDVIAEGKKSAEAIDYTTVHTNTFSAAIFRAKSWCSNAQPSDLRPQDLRPQVIIGKEGLQTRRVTAYNGHRPSVHSRYPAFNQYQYLPIKTHGHVFISPMPFGSQRGTAAHLSWQNASRSCKVFGRLA
uniref:Uncharacterized protein n=1 Tax=Esox lucius TaxID=8010 RepID=A0AAY5L6H2_ESOLU